MKFVAVYVAIIAFVSVVSGQQWINKPDYCGKPCYDRQTLVCAYNQRCYNVFKTICDMKKWNCDQNEYFQEANLQACLMGVKCRGIPIDIA